MVWGEVKKEEMSQNEKPSGKYNLLVKSLYSEAQSIMFF
jgi:hypothetical protein